MILGGAILKLLQAIEGISWPEPDQAVWLNVNRFKIWLESCIEPERIGKRKGGGTQKQPSLLHSHFLMHILLSGSIQQLYQISQDRFSAWTVVLFMKLRIKAAL